MVSDAHRVETGDALDEGSLVASPVASADGDTTEAVMDADADGEGDEADESDAPALKDVDCEALSDALSDADGDNDPVDEPVCELESWSDALCRGDGVLDTPALALREPHELMDWSSVTDALLLSSCEEDAAGEGLALHELLVLAELDSLAEFEPLAAADDVCDGELTAEADSELECCVETL